MPTRWALQFTWRDGGQEYLHDLGAPGRPVKEFDTPEAARARREHLLRQTKMEIQAIDVVPYPKPRGVPPDDD